MVRIRAFVEYRTHVQTSFVIYSVRNYSSSRSKIFEAAFTIFIATFSLFS